MSKLFSLLDKLPEVITSHNSGSKKILLHQGETNTRLTQLAYGKLTTGEVIPAHLHKDMEEYFFFTGGEGRYDVGKESIPVFKNVFVRIPAGTHHSLHATSNEALEFLYFGIAL